ncbi:acyl-CoA synthetase [Acidomonas methanolica]|uniref:AMP-dependent synthetase and ligase n=2 Tax=Acidomonas methanolica TaxID=437 RepID=A0A023D9H5_ACIMT|nr:crotonobetaine/carnitine-CoA ligase [Acidomonas methanolica]GAJ30778.1 AMP-dependent synthetase and ligase [Acidomonas methanolica NBRC 104435]GBQ46207.1 acyl-CoA synthetase [Acidomonas methanolica]GEL00717.1 ATP-dependent acyl-CoA ligase [Acidomonas methanolica NBRC 104435]
MNPEPRTLLRMVLDGAAAPSAEPILTFVEVRADGSLSESTRTYGELLENGRRLATALLDLGMKEGDAFAIIMRNYPEFVEAMLASEVVGSVFVPIDPRTRGDKLSYMLRFAGCRGAIVSGEVIDNLAQLREELPELTWVLTVDTAARADWHQPLAGAVRQCEAAADPMPRPLSAPMQMLYTSGTTGDPKAILAPNARFAMTGSLGETIGLQPGDRLYTGLSLTHANAQLITLGNGLAHQLPVVISRTFTKSRLWEIVSRYRCTTMNLLGGMATAIFAEPPGLFDLAHDVRFVLSAGMPISMWRPFEERFGVKVFEFFGAAEGGLTLNPPGAGPVASIGKAPPSLACEILDEDDHILGPGQLGEICFRNADGSVTPITYFKNPQASEAKTQGGWFRTGDIGWKDADGWLYFSHRSGQSIRRNGDFINPRDIETMIAGMPGVVDVYVYGVATSANTPGEKEIVAAVVVGPDWSGPAAVFEHCARQLGSTSVPSFVQILNEIPKTASEKPQDRFLIDLLIQDEAMVFNKNGPSRVQPQERITQ